MTVLMSDFHRAADGVDVVSPELALVDPVLASSARASLPDAGAASVPPRLVSQHTTGATIWAPSRGAPSQAGVLGRLANSSWTATGCVAAGIVIVLLFLDIHVDVGKPPPSAGVPGTVPSRAPARSPGAPPSSSAPAPRTDTNRKRPQRFAWAPAAGADGYHVEFFRDRVRVLSANTMRAEITVPAHWTYAGLRHTFRPGVYRWLVWPVVCRAPLRTSNRPVEPAYLAELIHLGARHPLVRVGALA